MSLGKYSPAQWAMLDRVSANGSDRCPSGAGPATGRLASAWHRTATSLARQGVLVIERVGFDGWRVVLPEPTGCRHPRYITLPHPDGGEQPWCPQCKEFVYL